MTSGVRSVQDVLIGLGYVNTKWLENLFGSQSHEPQFCYGLEELEALAVKAQHIFRAARGSPKKFFMPLRGGPDLPNRILQQWFILPSPQTQ